jgi:hypothetical protein
MTQETDIKVQAAFTHLALTLDLAAHECVPEDQDKLEEITKAVEDAHRDYQGISGGI